MSTVEAIENAVKVLPASDLAKFRRWFAEFDAAAWDAQIELDAKTGRLDRMAQEAVVEYRSGSAREI